MGFDKLIDCPYCDAEESMMIWVTHDWCKCKHCGKEKHLSEAECVEEDNYLREHAETVKLMEG